MKAKRLEVPAVNNAYLWFLQLWNITRPFLPYSLYYWKMFHQKEFEDGTVSLHDVVRVIRDNLNLGMLMESPTLEWALDEASEASPTMKKDRRSRRKKKSSNLPAATNVS